MRKTHKFRTICEVLRECYEIAGADQDELKEKLVEAQHMAKKMSNKLLEYNKSVFRDWWEKNKDYEKDLKRKDRKYTIKAT